MNSRLRSILDELHYRLRALYGDDLLSLELFGSQARGDADPGSDVDVLVVLDRPVDPGTEIWRTGDIVTDLSLKFDTVVSCLFVSAERFRTEQSPFLRNVRRRDRRMSAEQDAPSLRWPSASSLRLDACPRCNGYLPCGAVTSITYCRRATSTNPNFCATRSEAVLCPPVLQVGISPRA
jgi:predicted nucleotidyltransferase